MTNQTTLTLGEDELAILVDALEADLEDYIEAAKEARTDGEADQSAQFDEAARRVEAVLAKVRAVAGE